MPFCIALLAGAVELAAAATPTMPATTTTKEAASTRACFVNLFMTFASSLPITMTGPYIYSARSEFRMSIRRKNFSARNR
jgi:hypothetical protein